MESDPYRLSEHFTDEYALELLHRAMIQGEQEAWDWMSLKFGMQVLVSSTILCLPPNWVIQRCGSIGRVRYVQSM
jgi:hypothetical protein